MYFVYHHDMSFQNLVGGKISEKKFFVVFQRIYLYTFGISDFYSPQKTSTKRSSGTTFTKSGLLLISTTKMPKGTGPVAIYVRFNFNMHACKNKKHPKI